MEKVILSTAYFPPIQYISKIFRAEQVELEVMENFGKQSYRNRCEIMTANGILPLTVPVDHANSGLPIKEMRINYITPWQRLHLKGIKTAYTAAPYFDYFFDEIAPIFERNDKWLLDLNEAALETVLELLRIKKEIVKTTDFIKEYPSEIADFRNGIHPKPAHRVQDPEFTAKPYRQVFSDKQPFAPNLSILDLIFCEGYDAKKFL